MKTVYKKHTLIKVIIGGFVVIAILLGIFYALKEKQEQGTTLTEFEITNSDLSLVTDSVVKDYVHDKLQPARRYSHSTNSRLLAIPSVLRI